jgi:ABC-type uncharacterized transport system YnjBCD permease subunit
MELSIRSPVRTDFFAKRDERERALKSAIEQLEEFKKRSPETVFPKDIYGQVTNTNILYASEYIRLLEAAVLAKKSLEMMDIVLEGLMHERIKILEDLLK